MYHHHSTEKKPIALPIGKVVCVGRNYLDHIRELKNENSENPLIFIKPSTSLCALTDPIVIPNYSNDCQHEIELAVLILSRISKTSIEHITNCIWGYGIALDLTLRDIQSQSKQKGLPWEMAKAFDKACPISEFIPASHIVDPQNLELSLSVNGQIRQQGNTQQMIHKINELIAYISNYFTLLPGDVVLTGTPAGVGPLIAGDVVACTLAELLQVQTVCV